MNAIAPKLTDWVSMWRAALPGFETDSTWGGVQQRWWPIFADTLEDDFRHTEDGVTFKLLGMASPGGRYILDIDRYQSIAVEDETLEVGGEPDSWAVLIDRRANREMTLARCGTPCGYHWGAWLSPTSFALAGWQDADKFSEWKQGNILIYSMADSTVHAYATRIIPAHDYERYEEAWKAWLLGRYRDLKPSPAGS